MVLLLIGFVPGMPNLLLIISVLLLHLLVFYLCGAERRKETLSVGEEATEEISKKRKEIS